MNLVDKLIIGISIYWIVFGISSFIAMFFLPYYIAPICIIDAVLGIGFGIKWINDILYS